MTASGGLLFFSGARTQEANRELWISNGTESGTVPYDPEINSNTLPGQSIGSFPMDFTEVSIGGNTHTFFTADAERTSNVGNGINREIYVYRTDVAPAQVQKLEFDSNIASSSNPKQLTAFGEYCYFMANLGSGFRLYRTQHNTTSPSLEEISLTGGGEVDTSVTPVVSGSRLYFVASNAGNGNELYSTQLGSTTANLLMDINPGNASSDPYELTDVGGFLFFGATSANDGTELWRTNGTVTRLMGPAPEFSQLSNSSNPTGLTNVFGGLMFFVSPPTLGGRSLMYYNTNDPTNPQNLLYEDFMDDETGQRGATEVGSITPAANNSFFFLANGGGFGGQELWYAETSTSSPSRLEVNAPPQVNLGEEVQVTCQLFDQSDNTVPFFPIELSTGGVDTTIFTDITGVIEFAYVPANPGIDTIVCSAGEIQEEVEVLVLEPVLENELTGFTLIDAQDNTDIGPLEEIALIDLNLLGNIQFNIRVNTNNGDLGSVVLELTGPVQTTRTENTSPYAIFGDSSRDNYVPSLLPVGSYTITATPYTEPDGGGQAGAPISINFEVTDSFGLTDLVLFNADADTVLQTLKEGDIIDLSTLGSTSLGIVANPLAASEIGSVWMDLQGPVSYQGTENIAPFSLFAKNGNDINGKSLIPGAYTIKASPYRLPNREGQAGLPLEINFQVIEGTAPLSLELSIKQGFTVYPVPAASNLYLKNLSESNQSFNFIIRDLIGNEVGKGNSDQVFSQIDVSNLSTGVYFLEILRQEGKLEQYRFSVK